MNKYLLLVKNSASISAKYIINQNCEPRLANNGGKCREGTVSIVNGDLFIYSRAFASGVAVHIL